MNAPVADSRPRRPSLALAAPFSLAFLLAWLPPANAQSAAPAAGAGEPALTAESSVRELTARIEELERRLGASALLDLVTRIDRLKKEIQELRDHAEVQAHKIEALQGRQQDLYAELDRLAHRLAQPAPEVAGALPETGEAPGPAEESEDEAAAAVADPGSPADESGEPGGSRPAAPDHAAPGGVSEPIRESPPQYDPVEEQAQYQLAFDLLSEGRFERAANAFTEFLAAFPESRYQDTARFWKGECLYALRRFEPALEEFRGLVESHPDSSRIPGARLKIGFILHELGRAAEAVEELRSLVEVAPDSSEAKLARDRLERLR